jgi:hypothetical protein
MSEESTGVDLVQGFLESADRVWRDSDRAPADLGLEEE